MSREDNVSLKPLVEQLEEVRVEGSTTLKFMLPFHEMLPVRTSSFFRYSGSLTTPSCDQIVTWTVFKNPIALSENQASLLFYIILVLCIYWFLKNETESMTIKKVFKNYDEG